MRTLKFKTNINCGGCIAKVTPCLNEVSEIKNWHVDTGNPQKILTVETPTLDSDQIIKVVTQAGFKAETI